MNNIYYTNISYDDGFGSQYQKIIQTYIYCKMNNCFEGYPNYKLLILSYGMVNGIILISLEKKSTDRKMKLYQLKI